MIYPASTTAASNTCIGLIGGLAPRAGIFYYEQILARFNASQEPLELLLNHANVSTVLRQIDESDTLGLGNYLGGLANQLAAGGASHVAITAVAPHLAIKEISNVARVPVISVLATLTAELAAKSWPRVAILGNRAAIDTRVFGCIPTEGVVSLSPDIRDAVHAVYMDIALQGKRGTTMEKDFLQEIAKRLTDQEGAEAIILAGTDLSSFYAEEKPAFPYIDMAQLHIDEITRRTLQQQAHR